MKAIVLTTINVPHNIQQFMEKADSEWVPIVVGDLKTPHQEVDAICKAAHGEYLSPEKQKQLGFSHSEAIPWNCYDRKNIGYLFALREGAEIIFSTDDDNYPPDHWDSYAKLGKQRINVISSGSGWWNCCSQGDIDITPRGYPFWLIRDKPELHVTEKEVDVGVQVGLWLGDPDIDTMTRLVLDPVVTRYVDEDLALDAGTMCPYNSQNTFISREMMPAHMLWCGAQTTVYRYDDIFAGYVAQVICRHHGKAIKFGLLFLFQERNAHDLLKDLKSEIGGMECQRDFFSILGNMRFNHSRAADNLRDVVYTMVDKIPQLPKHLKMQVDTWCDDLAGIGL